MWILPLKILLLALLSKGIETSLYEDKALGDSLHTFLKTLPESQESYDIYFNFFDYPICEIEFLSTSIRYKIFKGKLASFLGRNYPYRYTQPFYILIGSYETWTQDPSSFDPAFLIGMHPTTLFVVPILGTGNLEPKVNDRFLLRWRNYPALKVLIYAIKLTDNVFQIQYKIVCNGYCENNSTKKGNFDTTAMKRFANPLGLHKALFQVGNGREVEALLRAEDEYFDLYQNNFMFCQEILLEIRNFRFCNTAAMTTGLLSRFHNISFKQLNSRDNEVFENVDKTWDGQYIINTIAYIDYGKNIFSKYWQHTGFKFNTFRKSVLIYCRTELKRNQERKIDYLTWCYPFTINIWISIAFTIIANTWMLKFLRKRISHLTLKQILDATELFLGISTDAWSNKIRLCVLLQFAGIFCCNFYGNGIMSVLIVPERIQVFNSLPEMLSAGYRICSDSGEPLRPWELFYSDFKIKGLLEKLNTSFYEFDSSSTSDLEKATLLTKKYAFKAFSTNQIYYLLRYKDIIVNQLNLIHAECYILPEKLNVFPSFVEMYTLNRHWMMETYGKFLETGLVQKWNEWQDLAMRYTDRISVENPNPNQVLPGDQISLPGILGILVICSIFCILCLVSLIAEILSLGVRKEIKEHFVKLHKGELQPSQQNQEQKALNPEHLENSMAYSNENRKIEPIFLSSIEVLQEIDD